MALRRELPGPSQPSPSKLMLIYGVGTNKRAKLKELLIEEKPLHEMPIQLAKHHQHAVLITDQNLTV